MKKLSVITINYNNADGLEKTIRSVVEQDYQDLEYIVIDGGSTDGSVDIIKQYADRITFWLSEPDKGIYNAMNKGVAHASGEYVNFMNSGDRFHSPAALSDIAPMLDCDIVAGKCQLAGTDISFVYFDREITLLDLVTDTLNHQATFIRTELLKRDPYDERFRLLADWAFTVKKIIVENRSFRSVNQIVADYDGTGVSSVNREQRVGEKKKYLQEILPPRVYADYMAFAEMRKSPLFNIIATLGPRRFRLQNWCARLLSAKSPKPKTP